jgi:argininosuccinate lyase
MPFRDAYKKVGSDIEAGRFAPEKKLEHSHEGSMGNLCIAEIRTMMEELLQQFNFGDHRAAVARLLE